MVYFPKFEFVSLEEMDKIMWAVDENARNGLDGGGYLVGWIDSEERVVLREFKEIRDAIVYRAVLPQRFREERILPTNPTTGL